jgi:fibronectin type 3 domain-containing protein
MKAIKLFCIIILITINGYSQTREPWAKPGKSGIFVKFGRELPSDFTYRLDRREASKKEWQFVQIFSVPKSVQETRSKFLMASAKEPVYGMPDDSTIARFWKRLSRSKICDSLYYYASCPLYLEVAGTGYFDSNILQGVSYEYRITKVNKGSNLSDPVQIKSEPFPGKKPEYAMKVKSLQATGKVVKLTWEFSSENHPFGIKVFRETYLQTNPQEIKPAIIFVTQKDNILAEIKDTEVAERMTYRYIIVPFDVFGNEAPPTDALLVVNVKPYGEAVELKKFTAQSADKENGIKLSWAYKVKKPMDKISIYRSDSFDNGFQKLATVAAEDTSYLDNNVIPVKSYSYFLIFDNVYGQSPPTNKVIGMLKPNQKAVLPPQQIGFKKVPEGNRIVWRKTDVNTKGYYVYRGNGYKSKLIQISPLIETDSLVTWYIDKNENLVPGVAYTYAVAAMNTSFSISPLSNIVYATPVSKTLPVPLNLKTMRYGKGVMLVWEDMKKIMPQITGYRVYRKKTDNKTNKTFGTDTLCKMNETNNYLDTLVLPGIHYVYTVSSLGISKTESESSKMMEYYIVPPQPFPPAGLRAIPSSGEVLIHWDEIASTDIKEYKLYREVSKGKPKLLATFKQDNTNYTDSSVDKGKTYYYKVTTVNLKGEESEKSDEVGVAVQ